MAEPSRGLAVMFEDGHRDPPAVRRPLRLVYLLALRLTSTEMEQQLLVAAVDVGGHEIERRGVVLDDRPEGALEYKPARVG
ncbi:MAG: hypothetical protein ICV69_08615 [Thermoleophilaceae bacterium]|nr:hypothetical protein [Thermoleophilaceae bacterium]